MTRFCYECITEETPASGEIFAADARTAVCEGLQVLRNDGVRGLVLRDPSGIVILRQMPSRVRTRRTAQNSERCAS